MVVGGSHAVIQQGGRERRALASRLWSHTAWSGALALLLHSRGELGQAVGLLQVPVSCCLMGRGRTVPSQKLLGLAGLTLVKHFHGASFVLDTTLSEVK